MKISDFQKSKDEIKKEISKNNQPTLLYDERNRMAKTNQIDYKLGTTTFFSLLSYMALFLVSLTPASIFNSPLLSSVPTILYPAIFLGSSVGLGTIARIIMEKKFKIKERLKSFTDVKTDAEKLIEEIKYEIELKKVANRNLALAETISKLDNDEKILRDVSNKYGVIERKEKTPEKSKDNIANLMNLLKEKYAELDLLTTKKTIADRFFHERQKYQNVAENLMASLGCGLGLTLYFSITLMTVSINNPLPTGGISQALFLTFIPMLTGAGIASIYSTIRHKNHKKAFATLNGTLEEDQLPEYSKDTYQERVLIENSINNVIKNIVDSTIELQEERRYIENFSVIEPQKLESSKELTHTKTIHQEMPASSIAIASDLETEEQTYETMSPRTELHQEIKTLTKKRKNPYQGK